MASDLLICRSGAMTLSEIAACGKASILIPSPNVTNDQQTKNARVLSDKSAAVLLCEKDLQGGILTEKVRELLEDDAARHEMERRASAFAVKDAEEKIWQKLSRLVSKK